MGIMKSFKEHCLTESTLSTGSLKRASMLISKYLKNKSGKKIFAIPGLEQFKNGKNSGVGIRYMIKGNKSIRFNWLSQGGSENNLASVDFWSGDKSDRPAPTYSVVFDREISLVKVLPLVADMLKTWKFNLGKIYSAPNDVDLNESFSVLQEAVDTGEAFNGVLQMLSSPKFSKDKVNKTWKRTGLNIFSAIEDRYPQLIQKVGISYQWMGGPKDIKMIEKDRDQLLGSIGAVSGTVSKGSGSEKYVYDKEIDVLEDQKERLSYEKQLDDLENLIRMMVSGASNALFVGGKGGIGKTFTVEKILSQMGLNDGAGYFKNTGSASAAGIYSLLFKHHDDIIFFDDSDDALKDQESRNIFKAATDTKKVRKLVWNKMGSNVVEPDEYESHEELLKDGKIPRYFNFTGKVIFISNLKLDKLDPDGALRTRAFMIEIDPTSTEIYDFMEKIADKIPLADGLKLDIVERKRVVGLLRNGKSKQSANLRKLSRALNMQAGSIAAGVTVSDADLTRMIETYA